MQIDHPTINIPTEAGTPFEGGFFVGVLRVDGHVIALIASPSAEGDLADVAWGKYGQAIDGATSYCDGAANTSAMAAAGNELALRISALQIGGFSDWYLPSRDELELIYRNLKPSSEANYTYRSGENPSAVPPTYPYTAESPVQTSVLAFQAGGAEALADSWYWSSTQYSRNTAWNQSFDDGLQGYSDEGNEGRARAVRRLILQ